MFSDPVKNLRFLDLREDMIVADLGAGTGFYSIPLSFMVPSGRVYALEIQRDFLNTLIKKIKEEKIQNIECIVADVEKEKGTKLKEGLVDRVIASNIFFQIENKENFIKEIKRILKINGKLLFIDLIPDSVLSKGKHTGIISKEKARQIFEKHGFLFEKEIDGGEHHHGMILFRK